MAKLCGCGCGRRPPLATKTNRRIGHVKGEPVRFVNGHQMRGHLNGHWTGGRRRTGRYVQQWKPLHPHAQIHGTVPEHRLVVERVLGKVLPRHAQVHHWNGDSQDNRPCNLLVCQDNAYHMLIHARMRALEACGDPSWRRCTHCKVWDAPANLVVRRGGQAYHRACSARYSRELYAKRGRAG